MEDTTDLHGAGDCTFETCIECQFDAACPQCLQQADLQTSRITGDVTRRCHDCGITFI